MRFPGPLRDLRDMSVKARPRSELIDRILDPTLQQKDKELAARALVRNFPAVTKTLPALILLVCPKNNPSAEVFDICCDAYGDAHT